jgi:hypothetical protein
MKKHGCWNGPCCLLTATDSDKHAAHHLMGKQKQQSLRVTTQDIEVLTLARFRFGRVLLHLLAMLGDRCVRFHIAVITRELPSGFGRFRSSPLAVEAENYLPPRRSNL